MCGYTSFIAYLPLLAALEMLELHGPDGQTAWVATGAIASLRSPTSADLARHFAKGAHCVVLTTDGKFIAVTETCSDIRNRLSPRTP